MNTRRLLVALATLALMSCDSVVMPTVASADHPVNAFWNDDGKSVGLWLYDAPITCESATRKGKDFVVLNWKIDKPITDRETTFDVDDLTTCAAFTPLPTSVCRSGKVTLTFDASTKAFRGAFAAKMSAGGMRSMAFRAMYCEAPPKS